MLSECTTVDTRHSSFRPLTCLGSAGGGGRGGGGGGGGGYEVLVVLGRQPKTMREVLREQLLLKTLQVLYGMREIRKEA